MDLPAENASNNAKFGGEMSEIHSISMIFTKMTVSHSILHLNSRSWVSFNGNGYVNFYLYSSEFLPVTHVDKPCLYISLVIRGISYSHGSRVTVLAGMVAINDCTTRYP
jgi:hypothetical protein